MLSDAIQLHYNLPRATAANFRT